MDNALGQDYGLFDTKEDAMRWLRQKVSQLSGGNPTGAEIYRALTREQGEDGIGQTIASQGLLDMGIPGIRYLDGNSRVAGEGSYNYVTFDPSRINVLERNGESMGLLGGMYRDPM